MVTSTRPADDTGQVSLRERAPSLLGARSRYPPSWHGCDRPKQSATLTAVRASFGRETRTDIARALGVPVAGAPFLTQAPNPA